MRSNLLHRVHALGHYLRGDDVVDIVHGLLHSLPVPGGEGLLKSHPILAGEQQFYQLQMVVKLSKFPHNRIG